MNDKPNYDYESFLDDQDANEILDRWDYPGTERLENDISAFLESQSSSDDDIEALINKIVLWKVNRQVLVDKDLMKSIVEFEEKDIDSFPEATDSWWDKVESIVNELVSCPGVRVAMASTILHFFHPSTFQIIDRRAYRVVFKQEMPKSSSNWGKVYVDYLLKCIEHYKKWRDRFTFDFQYFDRYTYQLDIEIGNKVEYGKKKEDE